MRDMVTQTFHLTRAVSVSSDNWFMFNLDLVYCFVTKGGNAGLPNS